MYPQTESARWIVLSCLSIYKLSPIAGLWNVLGVLSLLHPGCQQKFFLLSSEHIYDLPLLPNADPHFILVCLSVPLHDAVLSLQPLQLGCCQLIHLGVIRAAYSEWEGHGGVWDGFVLEWYYMLVTAMLFLWLLFEFSFLFKLIKKLLTFWSVLGLDGRLKFWLVYWLDQYVVRVVTYWVLRFKALLQDASWNWQIELYRKKNTFKYLKYHCQWELQSNYYISLQLSTTTAKVWGNFSFLLFIFLVLFDRTRGKKHEGKRVVSSNK